VSEAEVDGIGEVAEGTAKASDVPEPELDHDETHENKNAAARGHSMATDRSNHRLSTPKSLSRSLAPRFQRDESNQHPEASTIEVFFQDNTGRIVVRRPWSACSTIGKLTTQLAAARMIVSNDVDYALVANVEGTEVVIAKDDEEDFR
jgi:hypothetical protein